MSLDEELIPYVNDLYKHAKENVSFYKKLYINSPSEICSVQDFLNLPTINDGFFVRERLEDLITNYSDIYKIAYPEAKFKNDSTVPRVYDLNDLDNQYEILDWILDQTGCFENEKENSIAIIIDEKYSYEMGDVGQMLAMIFECPLFAMVVRGHSEMDIRNELNRIKPNMVFATSDINDNCLPDTVKKVFTFNSNNCYSGKAETINIWTNPYVGFIGYKKNGDDYYNINTDFYIAEIDTSNQILLTSFMQKTMPMIRYCTRNFGLMYNDSKIVINYEGTH